MTSAYNLTKENQEIIVRLNQDIFTEEKLTKFLEYLMLENISASSKLNEEQAKQLADDIDTTVWNAIKERILEE
ncbi:hypothetical protein ACN4EE_02195 [Geminocystis sp. CENA526]|uniref:hypothetical protein n=1 Tax=Geminocystis sp. CENA526 TaxID=1355871 RepID=UPI003D70069B